MSMAGTLYVTLVCWGDLSRFASDHKSWRRSLLVSAPWAAAVFLVVLIALSFSPPSGPDEAVFLAVVVVVVFTLTKR